MPTAPQPATAHTRAVTTAPGVALDPADVERARRGWLAELPGGRVDTPHGVVWDMGRYAFLESEHNPDTVHPGLWRQARLNAVHGLFEVAPGIWQARGYDISNITFVAGRTGWIVIDPLTAAPCARACLDLANATLGARPVVAVIYTHSHADHFGGVAGVTTAEAVAAGDCRIIAPEHFLREAVSENVIAGYAMVRRAHYQFGPLLPPGPQGHVDCGLGKAVPFWQAGLMAPTEEVTHTGQEMDVDGVRILYQLCPNSEAPAEMTFFFPDKGWLCTAENCTHTMHNLVPIRGAQVRDALAWSKYVDEMIEMFGARTEVLFASHHWPRWGREDVDRFLRIQRDLYRWIHDQTMRRANAGLTALEIAEELQMPAAFASEGHSTGYYGHLAHNVKAVYQRYLSWYDGNPAHLWQLPPTEVGRRYVDLAGGPERLMEAARKGFDAGDYRWVAELLNHLVFADPTHTDARDLQAATFEQLGYQAESATFRNAYLTGAQELRTGPLPSRPVHRAGYQEAMTIEQILDAAAARLRSEEVDGHDTVVVWEVTGPAPARWRIELSRGTLHARPATGTEAPALTVRGPRSALQQLASAEVDSTEVLGRPEVTWQGDPAALAAVFDHLEVFMNNFTIVEP